MSEAKVNYVGYVPYYSNHHGSKYVVRERGTSKESCVYSGCGSRGSTGLLSVSQKRPAWYTPQKWETDHDKQFMSRRRTNNEPRDQRSLNLRNYDSELSRSQPNKWNHSHLVGEHNALLPPSARSYFDRPRDLEPDGSLMGPVPTAIWNAATSTRSPVNLIDTNARYSPGLSRPSTSLGFSRNNSSPFSSRFNHQSQASSSSSSSSKMNTGKRTSRSRKPFAASLPLTTWITAEEISSVLKTRATEKADTKQVE